MGFSILSYIVFISYIYNVAAAALPTVHDIDTAILSARDDPDPIINATYYLDDFTDCDNQNPAWKQAIKDGFSEMIQIIGGVEINEPDGNGRYTGYPPFEWTSAAAIEYAKTYLCYQQYFGPVENTQAYRRAVQDNLDRAANVVYTWKWFPPWAPKMSVVCNDPENRCPCGGPDVPTIAYVVGHGAQVNFCPRFFTLPTLQGAMDLVQGYKRQLRGYVYNYRNRGMAWAHEIMHITAVGKPTGSWAYIADMPVPYYHPDVPYHPPNYRPAYGPQFTKWLAQSDLVASGNAEYASNNAENYALFFMANYVNRKKGFYPSLPQVEINPPRAPNVPRDWTGRDDTEAVAADNCAPLEAPTKAEVTITGTSALSSPDPTDLPKLSSTKAYCTETLDNGSVLYHEKTTDPCPYTKATSTAVQTTSSPPPPPPPPTITSAPAPTQTASECHDDPEWCGSPYCDDVCKK